MNALFVIPSISVTVGGLLNPWTGLGLLLFWIFSLYRMETKTDYGLVESLHLIMLAVLVSRLLFCKHKKGDVTRVESFFLGIFLFLFPVWLICQTCRGIWPNIFS